MDQLAGLVRQRLMDDYQLQKEVLDSVLATFTANDGALAKSIAVREEDREVCEFSDRQGALRFKLHIEEATRGKEPFLNTLIYTVVYVPESGMVFVHEAVRHGDAPTEGMPIPAKHELLPKRHSFEGWSRYYDDLHSTLSSMEAEDLCKLTIRVFPGEEFAVRKLVRVVDGRLESVIDPEMAKEQMARNQGVMS